MWEKHIEKQHVILDSFYSGHFSFKRINTDVSNDVYLVYLLFWTKEKVEESPHATNFPISSLEMFCYTKRNCKKLPTMSLGKNQTSSEILI